MSNFDYKAEALKVANEFAKPGTVTHFAMRLGFMPNNEEDAEALLSAICDDEFRLQQENAQLRADLKRISNDT